jgi:uncharacterized protein YukE
MSDLYLTYSSIDDAALDIENVKTGLLTLLGEVQTEIDGLGSGFHTQSASASFESAVTTFVTETTKAVTGLEGLGAILTGTVETFTGIDSSLAKALQG